MGVYSKQIGWSQESILLQGVSKQLERLAGIIASSGGGGGGGSQNLQQTLVKGNSSSLSIILGAGDNSAKLEVGGPLGTSDVLPGSITINDNATNHMTFGNNGTIQWVSGVNDMTHVFSIKPTGTYTIMTSGDLVSATTKGIVDNTSLQELGGVDKKINGLRVGKGNGALSDNTVLGLNALNAVTTSNFIVAIGSNALNLLTTGTANTAVGAYALSKVNSNNNTAVGYIALTNATTGTSNTAVGGSAGTALVDGGFNVAIGSSALQASVSGLNNVAIGASAMVATTTPSIPNQGSVGIGSNAFRSNTTGNGVALGQSALRSATTGIYNIGIGTQAGSGITTGSGNVILADTGNIAFGGGITTGSNNLILAPNSGNTTGVTTGSGNVIVGKVTGLTTALANTVIVSDGVGTQRFVSDSTNLSTLPVQTQALINGDATGKAIATKEWVTTTIAAVGANLQAVLSLGHIANGVGIQLTGGPFGSYSELLADFLRVTSYTNKKGGIYTDDVDGMVWVYGDSGIGTNQLLLTDRSVAGTATYKFDGNKSSGQYTIATLDNLNLNDVLTGGPVALDKSITINASDTSQLFLAPNIVSVSDGGSNVAQIVATTSDVRLTASDITGSTNLISNGLRFLPTGGSSSTILQQKAGSADTVVLELPLRNSGTYDMATIGYTAPSSASAAGKTGEIRITSTFIYWCIAANTWIRAAGATW